MSRYKKKPTSELYQLYRLYTGKHSTLFEDREIRVREIVEEIKRRLEGK